MATTIQKTCDKIEDVINQLKVIKRDFEHAQKQNSFVPLDTSIPDGVTLSDLYKAIRNYSKASAYNLKTALEANDINTISDLVKLRPRDLNKFKKVGMTTIYHTREAMEDLGILW